MRHVRPRTKRKPRSVVVDTLTVLFLVPALMGAVLALGGLTGWTLVDIYLKGSF